MKELKSVFSDFLSLQGGYILGLLLGIIALSMTTRFLGPENYGVLTLFNTFVKIIYLFGFMWLGDSIIRFGKEEFIKEASIRTVFWSRSLIISLVFIAVSVISLIFIRQITAVFGLNNLLVCLAILYLFLNILARDFSLYLQSIGHISKYAYANVINKFAFIIFLLALLVLRNPRILLSIILSLLLSNLCQIIYCLRFFKKEMFLPVELKIEKIKLLICYSWPLILSYVVGYLAVSLEPILIKKFLSIKLVGIYNAALQGYLFFEGSIAAVSTLAFSFFTSMRFHKREDLLVLFFERLMPQLIFIWGFFILFILTIADFLFKVLFGPSFVLGIMPFKILLLALIPQVIISLTSSYFSAHDMVKTFTTINIFEMTIQLTSYLLLIPRLGINGAAWGWTLCYIGGCLLSLVIINRKVGLKFEKKTFCLLPTFILIGLVLFPLSTYKRFLVLGLLMGLGFLGVRWFKVFRSEDIGFFKNIAMPNLLRRILNASYYFLAG